MQKAVVVCAMTSSIMLICEPKKVIMKIGSIR